MLTEKLHEDLITAQKAGDTAKVAALRYLLADVKNREIELRYLQNTGKVPVGTFQADGNISDQEVISIIQKQVKQHIESVTAFESGNRADLANKEATELSILEAYLPPQMARDDIKAEVSLLVGILPEPDQKNFGLVMRAAMAELKGRADGSLVQQVVKEVLGV
ncbi:MAG: GatB/YqeY domain-containing protein [candidate division WWE3 bacterium]|nr:GatB/YqeY domain-containing protein [candidate division WWE3 bacterium]